MQMNMTTKFSFTAKILLVNILISSMILTGAGCASAPTGGTSMDVAPSGDIKSSIKGGGQARLADSVAPGFEIELSNVQDKNLNGKFTVDYDGRLKLPYKVQIDTRGMTIDDLRRQVNESYKKYFRSTPRIDVSISNRTYWVEVRGLVEKAGRFLVKSSTSLDEIISMAGGLQKSDKKGGAEARSVKIEQGGNSLIIPLADYYSGFGRSQIPPWQGGEVIFFQSDDAESLTESELSRVQILGEVRNPGEYRLRPNSDLLYYVGKAGGPTDRADLSSVTIFRGPSQNRVSREYTLESPAQLPVLRGGDYVIVHAEKASTSFERGMTLFSSFLGVVSGILVIWFVGFKK